MWRSQQSIGDPNYLILSVNRLLLSVFYPTEREREPTDKDG